MSLQNVFDLPHDQAGWMALAFAVTLSIVSILSGVSAHGDGVPVWMDDLRLQYSGEGDNPGFKWERPYEPANYFFDGKCSRGGRGTCAEGAEVTLWFTGTSISIIFLKGDDGGKASVYLDNEPIDVVDTYEEGAAFGDCHKKPYPLDAIQDGLHNVTLRKNSSSDDVLFIHGFRYTPSNSSNQEITFPSRGASSESFSTASSSSIDETPSQTPSQTPTASPTQTLSEMENTSSSNRGRIAGGVIGGILLFIVAVILFYILRSRRERRLEPYPLDIDALPAHNSPILQSPVSLENTVPTPFISRPLSLVCPPSIASAQASSNPSSPIPQTPMTVQEKMQQQRSRLLPSTAPDTPVTDLAVGQAGSSGQLDAVQSLIDRNSRELISRVIDLMVTGHTVPNVMEGYELHQPTSATGPPPQYSAAPR